MAIMRPDPQAGALRDLVAHLMAFDDVNRAIGERMTGLCTRYDLGSERDDVGRLIGDRATGHGGTDASLYALMQGGQGVLLDATNEAKASRLVAASTQGVRCVAVGAGPSMLIRPDACVAWAGEADGADGLAGSLRRWFGPTGMP